jgi:glycosyltransferase involved in cell wall biosynthesis
MPDVSVIIPNYNHGEFLVKRIESVLSQSFRDFEVIILDDCSSDHSRTIIDRYRNDPKVSSVIYNELNSGSPFQQWKKGIGLAKGQWICIAESDDFCAPTFLSELVECARLHPASEVFYCQSFDVDEAGQIIGDRINETKKLDPNRWENSWEMVGSEFLKKYMLNQNVIPNASAAIFRNRPDWKDIFTQDLLEMRMCGDWYFWVKLLKGSRIYFLNKHLNFFRTHGSNTRIHNTPEKLRQRFIEQSIIEKYLIDTFNLPFKDRKLLSRYFALHSWPADLLKRKFYDFKGGFNGIHLISLFSKYQLSRLKKHLRKHLTYLVKQ